MPSGFQVGGFEVRPDERRVLNDGTPVPLGARAFDLLLCLIKNRDRVVPKSELLEEAWPGLVVEEANLSVQVSQLRKLMGQHVVATVAGLGYRLTAKVIDIAPAASAASPKSQPQPVLDPPLNPVSDSATHPQLHRPSIAVLPFNNFSTDEDQNKFADGLVEDIITALSRFRALFVIARNSSFTYKNRSVDARTVASELGVRYLLEGSLRSAGDRIRVTAQLIDAVNGHHLWAENYDRRVDDVFALQEELTRDIVATIAPHVEAAELLRVRAPRPAIPSAYTLAQRAHAACRFAVTTPDRGCIDEGLRLAHEALAIDPQCSEAWRAIVFAHWLRVYLFPTDSPDQELAAGLAAARRLIEMDYGDHLAYYRMGLLLGHAGRPEEGLAALRRAYELNPNHALNMSMLGSREAACGNVAKGLHYAAEALRLSPRDPVNHYTLLDSLAWANYFAGDYAAALELERRTIAEAPEFVSGHTILIVSLVALGRIEEARAAYPALQALVPQMVEQRLRGKGWPIPEGPALRRITLFLRIAAGLEDPSGADAHR